MPELIHCSICHKAIRVGGFKDRMKKLRDHRKKYHPAAFRKSIKKSARTRKRNKR